jgi:hypothetical protein
MRRQHSVVPVPTDWLLSSINDQRDQRFGVQRPTLKDSAGTFLQLGRRVDIKRKEEVMGFGRGALLWLLGVPLPIIILLALFWHY